MENVQVNVKRFYLAQVVFKLFYDIIIMLLLSDELLQISLSGI
jgi:hypothetical protein